MPYTKRTGGAKEFHYTPGDMKRIEGREKEITSKFKLLYLYEE